MSIPFLVKDINPGFREPLTTYIQLTAVGNILFFTATDGVNGTELWKSDGTAAGTVLVRDIRPGSGDSYPHDLTVVGNTLFFAAYDDVNGDGLWKSDGTAGGTVLIKKIRLFVPGAGAGVSSVDNLMLAGNTLFFSADDGVNGFELWKSDGTATGTVLVKDIYSGPLNSDPRYLTLVGNTLFFSARSPNGGSGLWKSNGTAGGTVLVKDTSTTYSPRNLTAVGNTLFFTATNNVNGRELWKSDGTTGGTVLVKDINTGFFSSNPSYLTVVGNTLFFRSDDGANGDELWKSDGTAGGTVLVKDIHPGSNGSNPSYLTVVGNTLFFRANDGVNGGYELWKSDGTAGGTVLVKNIRTDSLGSTPLSLTAVENTLFFTADDGINGRELWRSDGTAGGTVLVKDIRPGYSGSDPRSLTAVGNTLFFIADNGVNGRELWALNLDDAPLPTTSLGISATSADQTEGNSGSKAFTFTVTRSGSTTGANNVNWAVTGTGTNPANATDFVGGVLPNGTVSFAAGETSKIITVNVQGDSTVELNETFQVTLSNPTNGATIATASAQGMIQNDDTPQITLNVSPSSVLEDGATNLTYTFTRTGPTTTPLTVNYSISGTADATDYTGATPGTGKTITFAVGSAIATVTVDPTVDTTVEGDETVALTLATGAGYIIGTTNAVTGAIANDDAGLAISPGNADQTEGDSGSKAFTFIVNRSGYLLTAVSVDYTVGGALLIELVDGRQSATADDFTWGFFPSGTISFVAGETSKVITVNVQGDTTPEVDGDFPSEDVFIVTLSNPTNGATIATASAQGTIRNDDTSLGSTFTGTTGNDTLKGTTGADTLIGLAGNDTYTVNNSGDVVTENLNEGTDTVKSDITYTLPNNVEKLTLNGSSNLNGTGNELNNTLTGNSGANTLTGLAGNDTIDGKTGADTMIGGAGNDTYTVDNVADVVTENAGEGTDSVKASLDYTLGANLENLTLNGSANLNGTGNALNNKLTGNTGANILNGGAGADTLAGKAGNDTFIFRFGESTVTGVDRISDFAIGADKIDLLTQGGVVTGAPAAFTRAADSATTNINTIVTNVFADANGATAGNQALGLNSAALVLAGTSTYLIINDGAAGFQSANDLVVNLTGITGTLPALGTIPVANFFI